MNRQPVDPTNPRNSRPMGGRFSFFNWLKLNRSPRLARPAAHSVPQTHTAPDDLEADYKPLDYKVVRGVLDWMRPYKKQYALTTLIGLCVTLLEILTPRYMEQLIDVDIPGKTWNIFGSMLLGAAGICSPAWKRYLLNLNQTDRAYVNIVLTILVWAVTMGIALLLQRMAIWHTTLIGQKVIFNLRRAVFGHLQKLSMNYYDRTRFGRILTRGTSDIDSMSNFIVWGINTLVGNLSLMIVVAAIFIIMDWRIALSVLWLGPVLYFMNLTYRRRVGGAWRRVREAYTRVSTNLAENISGMRVVTAFNRQDQNLDAFNGLQEHNTANNMRAAHINGVYQPLLNVVGFVGRVIILLLGTYLVFHSSRDPASRPMTVGELIALYVYWDWFMGPVINFGNFYNDTMMAMACAERVQALLREMPQVTDQPAARPLPHVSGQVVFENVTFGYDPAKPVLHGISFTAPAGKTIALVGQTGCGKSTIVSLICRFYQPQNGRILIDGFELRDIQSESLHRQMGIVSQNNYLFSGTVLSNIRYARPEATEQEVMDAARQLNAYDAILRLKDGFATEVGERGSSLSLGQRQLICFTRAFLANPRILLLDEATSAMDTATELLIQRAMETLVANRTTFVVAHRLSTITSADLVLVLDQGHIIESGTHRTLLEKQGTYAALYREFTEPS